MADELKREFDVQATLIPGSSGIFDVFVDGALIFSKYQTGRFPEPNEISQSIKI